MENKTYSSADTAFSGEIQEAWREMSELRLDLTQPKSEHD